MLRVIVTSIPQLRDAFIHTLSLEEKETSPIASIYQKGGFILLFRTVPASGDFLSWILDTFLPDRVYFVSSGYSLDVVHEIGDIIAPNVFLSYNTSLKEQEINEDNRDTYMESARFITSFDEQKDYYVEDYGLSVGGIVVDGVPPEPDDATGSKMMLTYEADIYVTESLSESVDRVTEEEVTALILVGIIHGKPHQKYPGEDPFHLVAKNMMTTMKLMEED